MYNYIEFTTYGIASRFPSGRSVSHALRSLNRPLTLRGKTLKTRLLYPVAQPHFLQANQLYPDDPVVTYYASRAKNGAAILLMQDLTNLDQRKMPADCGHFAMYDIDDIGCQNGFTFMAEMVHYYGSYITPELNLDNRMPLQVNDPNAPSPYGEPMNPFAMVSKDDEDEETAASPAICATPSGTLMPWPCESNFPISARIPRRF